MLQSRRKRLLLVEDNPGDVRLFYEALRAAGCDADFYSCAEGDRAMHVVRQCAPDVVVLDLNLPAVSGHEILAQLKADETLRVLPVVIWSSTCATDEIKSTYLSGASCFVSKPLTLDETFESVREFCLMWFQRASLPTWP